MKPLVALIAMLVGICGSIVSAQCPTIFVPPAKSAEKHRMKLLAVGEKAPEWQLADPEGQLHSLTQYRGKVVVLDFWATWCEVCAEIMPRMQKLHEKLADQGVVVIGVNSWEKKNDPIALMKKKRFTYELLLKGEQIAEAYKVSLLPVVYIIGDDGTIIYCHEGLDDKNLVSLIEKYIEGRRAT